MLNDSSRDSTTFSDGVSLYRFQRLPFGLSCIPAIRWPSYSHLRLGRGGSLIIFTIWWYLPLILRLLSRLDTLLQHLSKGGVTLNFSTCAIRKRAVKFLGRIVSDPGCRPNPENIKKTLQNVKPPSNVKGVRSFLGMGGFYWRHIPRFAKIAAPLLTNLTRKSAMFH